MRFLRRVTFLFGLVATPAAVFAQASVSEHLTMGNPSKAKADSADSENFLMVKSQYVLSYNKKTATPNWVSWHLSKEWLGKIDRSNDFRPDDTLPSGWFQVNQKSFSGSGFDRGHMCPSGDRTNDRDDNSATFLMSNMVPQSPRNNRQTWMHLESYSRDLVKNEGDELYIIAGPHGIGGRGKNGFKAKVVDKKTKVPITVPNATWKVILVLPEKSGNDVARVNADTRVIAVVMPNSEAIETDWTEYRVSVRDVEELTGFDFFSEVSKAIQDSIETDVDDVESES
jgi:endonuclease G, mitochondrial